MSNNINTFPIQNFISIVKSAELSQQKEIKLDIKTARILALTLGELQSKKITEYEKLLDSLKPTDSIIELKMDGGGFK